MLSGFYVNSGVLQFRLTSDPEEASRPQTAKAPKVSSGNVLVGDACRVNLFNVPET